VVGLIARDIKELNQFILISIFIEVANVNTLTSRYIFIKKYLKTSHI